MVDRAVVIFLFAQEKLLFRYPIHNPFHIDVNGGLARARGKSPAVASDTTTTVTSNATTATTKASEQQQRQKQKQPSTAAPAGVGVRKKRRNTMRSHPTPATVTAGEAVDSKRVFDADGSGAVKAPHFGLTPSLVANAAPHAGHTGGNSRKGSHSEAGEDDDTCVGVQTTVLVHLLRARFLSCTTIQFAGSTFLIYPLLPSNVKAQRLDADEPRRSRNFTTDGGLVDVAHGNGDDENEDGEEGKVGKEEEEEEEGEGEGRTGKRAKVNNPSAAASQGVVLVVAMNQPDSENGVIANLVQVFMNVLVREELRSHYATEQVLRMERRMQAWDMGGDCNGNDGGLAKHDAPPCSGRGRRKRLSASDMFAELLKDAELSLCREISLLAQHITAVKHNSKTEDVVMPSRPSPVVGPSNPHRGSVGNNNNNNSSSKSRNITGSSSSCCCHHNNGGGGGGGVSVAPNVSRATELVVRGLFTLPVAAILGRRRSAPYHTSAYVKQNPNLIVTLEDPYFAERLAKPYVEAVGWCASQLLPLSSIFATLGSLSRPWRMGGLHRALERCLASTLYQRQTMKQQQQQQQPQSQMALATGSNSTTRFGWIRTEDSFSQEGGGNPFSLEDQNSRLDVDALIVEAVEFLRLRGALAIDDEITVVFTHGDLSPEAAGAARWPRKKKGGTDAFCPFSPTTFAATHFVSPQDEGFPKSRQLSASPVAPASMIGVLVFEGMRSSCGTALGGYGGGLGTPFFGTDEVPDTPASFLKATVKTSTSSAPSSPPVFSLPNTSGGDVPQFEVYCAWGNACPICEELASAPHAWRIGNSPIRLSFPFLAAPIAEAAARRGRQGTRLIDPECCRLMADQRPWFTRANAFTVPVAQTEVSPVQKYRHLTRGCEDAAAQKVKEAVKAGGGCSLVSRADSGGRTKQNIPTKDEKFTAITPGSTPVMVREWLAENRSVIEGRLADALKQRQLLEEHTKQVTEKRAAAAAAAAAAAVEAATAAACSNAGGNHGQQPHLPLPSQRYHKRGFLSPGSVPGFAGEALPLSPASLTPSHGSFSPLRPHYAVGDGQLIPTRRMIGAERVVPFEALMQFTFHHTVALLWGKPGIGVETLLYLLECNLRRLRPFLAHHTCLQQLMVATGSNCATAAFSDTASCSSEQAVRSLSAQSVANSCNAFQVYPSCPPTTSMQGQEEGRQQKGEGEEVLSSLEQQLLEAYTVFTELSLMDLLRQLHGMTVEVVPTRLLLHAVVNAFADVLLVGRGNSCGG
ncbi:hypothetical protein TraAM80_07028 [Trypanosoma rangeli]|uniref:Uncharacterized protein n=1 Tax=Trypanosoma rangeli TaxID=5698 RepID=A0A422N7E1_TRYRA|nr:uncharacterized protein TraAM80_07028 [Trypanosoma rangeli]RNF01380.1 hypothetical protein TraAM80_07028 [Trypanosoma rangeli]|eukprot:RNF01380.1 hypothetical protein TraAM80_07028 [Trypanosoma rangeli]